MKRLIFIMLLSFVLVACGGGSSSSKSRANTEPGGNQVSQSSWDDMKWDEGVWD